MTEKILLTSLELSRLVPMIHAHNWRKGNLIILSPLVIKRVTKYAVNSDEPTNSFNGYYKAIIEYANNPTGLPCYHCRKTIPVGDLCYSKHRGRNTRGYYHLDCAKLVNLLE